MDARIQRTSKKTQSYQLMQFEFVLVTPEHSPLPDIPSDTIVIRFTNRTYSGDLFWAYWNYESNLQCNSVSKSKSQEIIKELPTSGNKVHNKKLIDAIKSKFQCDLVNLNALLGDYIDLNMDKSKCHIEKRTRPGRRGDYVQYFPKNPWDVRSKYILPQTKFKIQHDIQASLIASAFKNIKKNTTDRLTLIEILLKEIQFYLFLNLGDDCKRILDDLSSALNPIKQNCDDENHLWAHFYYFKTVLLMRKNHFTEAKFNLALASKKCVARSYNDLLDVDDLKTQLSELNKEIEERERMSPLALPFWQEKIHNPQSKPAPSSPTTVVGHCSNQVNYSSLKLFWQNAIDHSSNAHQTQHTHKSSPSNFKL